MRTYKQNRQWSDQFINPIRQLMGLFAFEVAPDEIDQKFGADLLSFRSIITATHILARVRDWESYDTKTLKGYLHEFTIREHLDSGAKTEYAKIMEGGGNYLLYVWGRMTLTRPEIMSGLLIDLGEFRKHQEQLTYASISNGDGTYFRCYQDDDLVVMRRYYHLGIPNDWLAGKL